MGCAQNARPVSPPPRRARSPSLRAAQTQYKTTLTDASKESASATKEYLLQMRQQKRINKNASNGPAIIGNYGGEATNGARHFRTISKMEFVPEKSTASSIYDKVGPAFDRQSACATNYSLALPEHADDLASTQSKHYPHPELRERVVQPVIGGWTRPNGAYKTTIEADESVMRGGGGSEGALGVRFNIITGSQDDAARDRQLMRAGRRVSNNHRFNTSEAPLVVGATRELPHPRCIVTGREMPRHNCPQAETAASLKRPDVPVLRTRPW